MNSVNKTLYIPLYGKSYVSKKGLFLDDKKAEEIWEAEGFSLKGKSKSKWLAYYMGIRSAVFDEWLKQKLAEEQNMCPHRFSAKPAKKDGESFLRSSWFYKKKL